MISIEDAMELFEGEEVDYKDYLNNQFEKRYLPSENHRVGGRWEYNCVQTGGEFLELTNYEKPVKVGWQWLFPLQKPEKKNLEKLKRNLSTTRRDCQLFTLANLRRGRDSFLTLTYDENQQNFAISSEHLYLYFKKLNYHIYKTKKSILKYQWVLELQDRGAIHYHVILYDIGFVPQEILSKLWGRGRVWIEEVKQEGMVSYLSKYITKETGIPAGVKMYGCSRNLVKPEKFYTNAKFVPASSCCLNKFNFENEWVGRCERSLWVKN